MGVRVETFHNVTANHNHLTSVEIGPVDFSSFNYKDCEEGSLETQCKH